MNERPRAPPSPPSGIEMSAHKTEAKIKKGKADVNTFSVSANYLLRMQSEIE
jgi:hypothetical protein